MARKDNETKINNRDERIVKRNWLRIGIITTIVIVVLALIGVGIYYLVDAVKHEDYEVEGVEMNADIEDVTDEILKGDKTVGMFFYTEGSTEANYLLRGNTVYDDGTDGLGAVAEVMESDLNSDITWYGINLDEKKNDDAEEVLFINPDSSSEDPTLREEFEYLGQGSLRDDALWYFDSIDASVNATSGGNHEVEEYKADNFSMRADSVDGNDDDDYKVTISTGISSDDETLYHDWTIENGTFMMFNGTQLTALVDDFMIPTDEVAEETTMTYNDVYVDWISELIEHNWEI